MWTPHVGIFQMMPLRVGSSCVPAELRYTKGAPLEDDKERMGKGCLCPMESFSSNKTDRLILPRDIPHAILKQTLLRKTRDAVVSVWKNLQNIRFLG